MTEPAEPAERWLIKAKIEATFEADLDVVRILESFGERQYWTGKLDDAGYEPWERPAAFITEVLGEDGPEHFPGIPGVVARTPWPEAWDFPWTEADYERLVQALPWVEPRSEHPEEDALRATPTDYDQPLF